jgi:hypothetical protein
MFQEGDVVWVKDIHLGYLDGEARYIHFSLKNGKVLIEIEGMQIYVEPNRIMSEREYVARLRGNNGGSNH